MAVPVFDAESQRPSLAVPVDEAIESHPKGHLLPSASKRLQPFSEAQPGAAILASHRPTRTVRGVPLTEPPSLFCIQRVLVCKGAP